MSRFDTYIASISCENNTVGYWSNSRDEESNTAPFNLGFEGKMRHVLKCFECERKWERIEPFYDLEVSIVKDLYEGLCLFIVKKYFIG